MIAQELARLAGNVLSFVGWIKAHRAVSTVPHGGYVLRTLSTLPH